MKPHVIYDKATGRILQCTDGSVSLQDGEAALEVTQIVFPNEWVVDLETLELAPAPAVEIPVEVVRTQSLRKIDLTADIKRRQLGSPGEMQAVIYLLKREEARRYQTDPAPAAAQYPLLSAEVGITGPNMNAVAAKVLAASAQWLSDLAQIEAERLQAKKVVESAP